MVCQDKHIVKPVKVGIMSVPNVSADAFIQNLKREEEDRNKRFHLENYRQNLRAAYALKYQAMPAIRLTDALNVKVTEAAVEPKPLEDLVKKHKDDKSKLNEATSYFFSKAIDSEKFLLDHFSDHFNVADLTEIKKEVESEVRTNAQTKDDLLRQAAGDEAEVSTSQPGTDASEAESSDEQE